MCVGAFVAFASGCRAGAQRPPTIVAPSRAASPPVPRADAPSEVPVRARAARPVPRCAAGELVSLARSSPGVDPQFALARRNNGGIVAFVSRTSAGARGVSLLVLDAQGRPVGAPREIPGASDPSDPALVATSAGYVLAFRDRAASSEDRAAIARERLVVAAIGPDGASLSWPGSRPAIPQGQPLAGFFAFEAPADQPGWGPVALGVSGDQVRLVAARGRAASLAAPAEGATPPASVLRVDDLLGAGVERAVPVAEGPAALAWDRAPAVIARAEGRAWALEGRARGARALLAQFDEEPPAWIAEGVGAPSALSLPDGALLGYVAASRDGATIRVRALDVRGARAAEAPSTVAVYGPSLDPRVGLVSLGPDTVGVVTLSHMADDATGSVNLSLVDAHGAFIGRHAALASIRLRRARVAVAAPPAPDGSAWVLLDGRADDGAPVLGSVTVRCDLAQEVSAQSLPSATMMQESAPPDEPPFSLDRPGALAQCAPRGAATVLAMHGADGEDATAGASWRSVALRDGRVLLFARRRAAGGRLEWTAAAVSAEGPAVARGAIPADELGEILDAAEVAPNEAWALTAGGALLRVRPSGMIERAGAGLPEAWSARFVRGGSGIVAATRAGAGVRFAYLPLVRGRVGTPVNLTEILDGHASHTVLDAVTSGSTVHALLGRRADGALARAVVSWDARRPSAGLALARDPAAEPLSIGGQGGALLARDGALHAIWNDRATLRMGQVRAGVMTEVRSLFGYLSGGGEILSAHGGSNPDALVVAARPGTPASESEPPARYAVTVHGPDGAVRTLSLRTPEDPAAIPGRVEAHPVPGGIAVVYARARAQGALEWLVQRAGCAQGQGGSR
jgi:hypothetical protein